jgi:hypothetical protein
VTYIIENEGKLWQARKITGVVVICKMMGGVGRNYSRGVTPFFNGDPDKATCEHCKA